MLAACPSYREAERFAYCLGLGLRAVRGQVGNFDVDRRARSEDVSAEGALRLDNKNSDLLV